MSTRKEIIGQVHAVEERHRAEHIQCNTACQQDNHYDIFNYTKLI